MSDVAPNDFPEEQNAPRVNISARQTLGQRLAAEREARGWSIDDVAGQLNLAIRQIQALEDDNYAALPGIASVRGFVRAYAKLLRVDADALVALIVSEQIVPNQPLEPKPNLSSAPFSHSRLSGGPNHSNSVKGAIFALVVVLLAAGAIGIEHMGGWPTLSQSLSTQFKDLAGGSSAGNAPAPAENHDTTSDAAPPVKPAAEGDTADKDGNQASAGDAQVTKDVSAPASSASDSQSALTQTTPEAVQPAASAPLPAPTSAPAPVQPAAQATAATSAQAAAASKSPAVGTSTLVLSARQNSWVEVRAGTNVVASHLLKAGDTETIDVPGAAQLTIGNAAGVDATFRGQPLQTTDGKTNVAHISLK